MRPFWDHTGLIETSTNHECELENVTIEIYNLNFYNLNFYNLKFVYLTAYNHLIRQFIRKLQETKSSKLGNDWIHDGNHECIANVTIAIYCCVPLRWGLQQTTSAPGSDEPRARDPLVR